MTEVISVKFNSHGKAYYFDPNGVETKTGDTVIVETSKGLDIGECAFGAHYVTDESIIPPLRPVIRVATEDDLRVSEANKEREKEAFEICREKIETHGLDMKLVDVECGFEGNKILFFFTADGRVDFRDLVKDLAAVFRTRIELRQIGVRDETKMLGGLGICGRPYCCSQFLNDFQPVSTKMAKTQSMSLNPTKISGSCGRLMCCLRYEQDAYEDLIRNIPKIGAFVQTTKGYGSVVSTNVLRQKVKVRIDNEGEEDFKVLDAAEVASVPGGRPKPGEPNPHVLNFTEKTAKDEETENKEETVVDPWEAPSLFAEKQGAEALKAPDEEEKTANENTQNRAVTAPRQQFKPKPQQNGGKNHNQPLPNIKHGNPVSSVDNNSDGAQTHNPQRPHPNGEAGNKTKAKQQNQNRNKKHYYSNKAKNNHGNQNSAT